MTHFLRSLFLPVLGLFGCLSSLQAQIAINPPAGLKPNQDLEVYTRNGFLVQQKFTLTDVDPNTSINTLSCATSSPLLTSPAGIMKDPGGDGNYSANMNCSQRIKADAEFFEIVFEDLDTELNGDLVSIVDANNNTLTFSGSTLPAPFFVTTNSFRINFQSNNNTTVGRGFRVRWRGAKLETAPSTPATGFGHSLQFDAQKGALVGGYITTGQLQQAGASSTALGSGNRSIGDNSTSLGSGNTASGFISTALGASNVASGAYSTAFGKVNTASGAQSTVFGTGNTASGDYSTALGSRVSTNGQVGVFVVGDSDPLSQGITPTGLPDQFVSRFLNGYYLLTSGNSNPGSGYGSVRTGVQIGRGQNSWASISDSTKKERFQPINQAELLRKIGSMKLTTWNYKGQQAIRHYGPMAQDFYGAFGQDGLGQVGCDTLIYSHDFAGVTFAGVQALIKENEQLKAKLLQTNARLDQTVIRLEALEAVMTSRRSNRVAKKQR